VATELELLRVLGYHLHFDHPHKFLLNYFFILGLSGDELKPLRQTAWNVVNDWSVPALHDMFLSV
jgi:hypothetical protein